jgi:hypothetical protein
MMMGKLSFSLSHARVETYAVYAVVHCVFSTLRPVHPRVTKHPDTALSTPQDYASITE